MTEIGPEDYRVSSTTLHDRGNEHLNGSATEAMTIEEPEASGRRNPRTTPIWVWGVSVALVVAIAAVAVLAVQWSGASDDLTATRDDLNGAEDDIARLEKSVEQLEHDVDVAGKATKSARARAEKAEAEAQDLTMTVAAVENFFVEVGTREPDGVAPEVTRCMLDEMGLRDFLGAGLSEDPAQVDPRIAGVWTSAGLTCGLPY